MASNLAKRSNGNNQIVKSSLQQHVTVTAEMLDRAVSRTGKELSLGETTDWYELLERQPGPAIRWAFMEHAKQSEFFPKPAEILGFIRSWHSLNAATEAEQRRAEEKAETERRLAKGERIYGLGDVVAEFKRIAAKADLPAERKAELQGRIDQLVKGNRK